MAPVETISVLFSDLVGSTALSFQVGPTVAERLRQEHFGLLRAAIEETGGREVKNLVDGVAALLLAERVRCNRRRGSQRSCVGARSQQAIGGHVR